MRQFTFNTAYKLTNSKWRPCFWLKMAGFLCMQCHWVLASKKCKLVISIAYLENQQQLQGLHLGKNPKISKMAAISATTINLVTMATIFLKSLLLLTYTWMLILWTCYYWKPRYSDLYFKNWTHFWTSCHGNGPIARNQQLVAEVVHIHFDPQCV